MNLILAKLRVGSNKSLHYNPIRRTFPGLRPFHLARFSSTHIHLVLWVHKGCSLLCGYTVTSWLTLGIGLHTCNPHGIRNMSNTDVCRVDPREFLYLEHKMLDNSGTWIKLSKISFFWLSVSAKTKVPQDGAWDDGKGWKTDRGHTGRELLPGASIAGCVTMFDPHLWAETELLSWVATPGSNISRFPPFPALTLDTALLWSVPPADHFESFVFNYACWPSVTRWLPGSMTPSSISVLATGVRQQIPGPGTVKWKIGGRTWASTKYLQAKRYAPPCFIYPPKLCLIRYNKRNHST